MGYVDSDYTCDLDKRRSTTGYIFTLAGGPIIWKAIVQSFFGLYKTELEYIAIMEDAKEALWSTGLVKEFGLKQESLKLYCDSQSAIHLTKNQVCNARKKHIDVRYHTIKEWVEDDKISLIKIHTENNAADILTKPVTTQKFKHCLDLINLSHCYRLRVIPKYGDGHLKLRWGFEVLGGGYEIFAKVEICW